MGVTERNFAFGANAEGLLTEFAVARLLAGHIFESELTDWQAEAVADDIGSIWHVAPTTIPTFVERFGDQVSAPTHRRLSAISKAATIQGQLCREVAADVADVFANRDIDLVALKGTANGFLAYADPAHRTGADLDFCVRPEDLDGAKDAMRAAGFWAGDYDAESQVFVPSDPKERERREDGHYALGFWVKMIDLGEVDGDTADGFAVAGELLPFASEVSGRHVKTPVLIDIHHSVGAGVSAEDIMDRFKPHVWNSSEIYLPPCEWMAFHALLKLYWEGGQGYRKGFQYLADFARILPLMTEEELDGFIGLVEGHNLKAGGYYVMRRMPACIGIDFSDAMKDVLEQWSTPPGSETPASYNDIGDFWPRLFGRL
ncbi:MAG TPA: nucleotidyltransferase family protein [Alphaproteobacteria bacterium]|nr:nucleotidyltransferase family protein [Alphaproteobacteria bacterium]